MSKARTANEAGLEDYVPTKLGMPSKTDQAQQLLKKGAEGKIRRDSRTNMGPSLLFHVPQIKKKVALLLR